MRIWRVYVAQTTLTWSQYAQPTTSNLPADNGASKLWQILSLPLLLFLVLPLVALFVRTPPDSLIAGLQTPQVRQAVGLSMLTTLVTVFVTVLFGTPVAYLLARHKFVLRRLRLRRLVDTVLDLPMVLPPAVAGVALLMAFGRRGIWGSYLESLGIDIAFTMIAVILAQTFVAASFYVKAATLGFRNIAPELAPAAAAPRF